jgi:hypothetical protein
MIEINYMGKEIIITEWLFNYSISKDINILNFYYFIILYLIYGWTNNLIILIFIYFIFNERNLNNFN